ncbi:hypothetical protein [Microcoleus sp. CAWBG58]|uniref:hypothetical protein n=1 Tax=Microcoleus sp. CAWBG58 TaxID=2841651 RepID=UPI0025FB74F2|nr:hypothetical protein [Microcoleus sp. CAWBG58]
MKSRNPVSRRKRAQSPELILTFFSDRLWLQLSPFSDYRKLDRCCPEFGDRISCWEYLY